jgi:hypothetical protein
MNGPMDAGQPIGDRSAVHRASIPFLGDRSAVRAELLSPMSRLPFHFLWLVISYLPFLVARLLIIGSCCLVYNPVHCWGS